MIKALLHATVTLVLASSFIAITTAPVCARENLALTIVNDSATSDLIVVVKGSSSKHDETVGLVQKNSKTDKPYALPVSNGATITVLANLADGGTQVDSEPITIRGEAALTIHVNVRSGHVLGGDAAQALITDITRITGNNNTSLGAAPYDGAINSLMGEMIVYDASDPTAQPIDTLPPSTFGNNLTKDQMDLSGTFTAANEVKLTTTLDAKVSATIPIISAVGASLSNGYLYDMAYNLQQSGQIIPKKGAFTPFYDALSKIPDGHVKFICNLVASAKTPKIFYITTMWGIGGGSISEQTATKLTAQASLSGNAFVVGNAAYDFSNATTNLINVKPVVLAYAGNEVPASVLCAEPTTTTTTVNVAPSQTVSGAGTKVKVSDSVSIPSGVYSLDDLKAVMMSAEVIGGVPASKTVKISRHVGMLERFQSATVVQKALPPVLESSLLNQVPQTKP